MPEKKRSRKDPATLRNLVGYTDESGNTGKNLFDDAQPYFWTAPKSDPGGLTESAHFGLAPSIGPGPTQLFGLCNCLPELGPG